MLRALLVYLSLAVATVGHLALTLAITLDPVWGVSPALYALAAFLAGAISFGVSSAAAAMTPKPSPVPIHRGR